MKRNRFDKFAERESFLRRAKRHDETTARGRCWKSAEVKPRDDGESAEGADEKFVKVVAGDVLDHSATALAEAAGAVHEFSANKEVARRAIGMAERGIYSGTDNASDGGFEIERDGEREKLFLFVESGGEVVEAGAGIDADGEVARIVVRDFVETGHVEGDVVTQGRHTDLELGAMTARNKGEFFEGGKADDLRNFLGGRGLCDD